MSETQSAFPSAPPPTESVVTDSLGRRLTILKMGPADLMDLYEACEKNVGNTPWFANAYYASSLRAINGIPLPRPTTPTAIKGLVRKLGEEGMKAIQRVLDEAVEAEATEKSDAAIIEPAKN